MRDLELETGAGRVSVSLAGDWSQDVQADIQGGVGQLTVLLPSDVGVRADVEQGMGAVNAPGSVEDGDLLVNEAYGESEATISLNIDSGVGETNLEFVD